MSRHRRSIPVVRRSWRGGSRRCSRPRAAPLRDCPPGPVCWGPEPWSRMPGGSRQATRRCRAPSRGQGREPGAIEVYGADAVEEQPRAVGRERRTSSCRQGLPDNRAVDGRGPDPAGAGREGEPPLIGRPAEVEPTRRASVTAHDGVRTQGREIECPDVGGPAGDVAIRERRPALGNRKRSHWVARAGEE
jgi:hypothetical protein